MSTVALSQGVGVENRGIYFYYELPVHPFYLQIIQICTLYASRVASLFKIIVSRSVIFGLKFTKTVGGRAPPGPARELTALPTPNYSGI